MTSGRALLQATPTAGLGSRWCGKTDRVHDAPVPGPFGAVLDDEGVQPANTCVALMETLPVALNTFRADALLPAALAIPRPVWRQLQASFLAHFIASREKVPAKRAPDVRYQSTPWL